MLVALSGGADSSALLWLAVEAIPQLGIQVRACHVHHGLRGVEADQDADACRRLCEQAGVPCVVKHVQIDPERIRQDGVESAARAARYAALTSCAGPDELIALAHTLDDQAETVLLNVIRGSGSFGLGGMSERQGQLIRPLLTERRQTLRRYCMEHQITWREDSSNTDIYYARNRLRLHILPQIEAINPGFVEAAGRLAEIQRAECQWWSDFTDSVISCAGAVWNRVAAVPITIMYQLNEAVWGRLLLRMVERAIGSRMYVEREHIRLIMGAVRSGASLVVELPRGVGIACVRNGWVSIEAPCVPEALISPASQRSSLQVDDVILNVPPDISGVVRYPKRGDKTLINGRLVTVGEYLRRRRVPPPWRQRVPVLALSGQTHVIVPDWKRSGAAVLLEPAPPMTLRAE